MFDKEANNFDALIIATPDHTHAVFLMAGLRLKKHIYCANPFGGKRRGLAGGLLLGEDSFVDFEQPARTMRRCSDHYGEWIRACKTGGRTVCPIEMGCEMTEMAFLGRWRFGQGAC